MLLASIGIATNAFELLAATIGSGLVVGSFVAGLLAIALSCARSRAERWVLNGGYFGGLLALLGLMVDIVEKRFV
ncbi:MAG TPA: hypothetical protein VG816_05330 [Solirubrobacterales bacterium]|nr:hypothetical protein [Solirubrobacterales bacterium]